MTIRPALAVVTVVLALSSAPGNTLVEARQDEFQVKAAFLLNFVRYVEWPKEALGNGDPITIALLGTRGDAQMEEWLGGKTAQGRPVVVRRAGRASEAVAAHVLFVGSDATPPDSALRATFGRPVLTVTEVEDAGTTGAVINLFVRDGRLAFGVNLDTAGAGRLQLSSKLLALARALRRDGRERD